MAECFPVLTQYVWGARDRGARLVVVDPRETAMARTADEHVRLWPGTDAAFYNGLLHVELVREVPEAAKPRTIAIQAGTPAPRPKVIDQQQQAA